MFMELIALLLIVFGVLQIILFFKLWKMTNDVNKIKNKITQPSISISIIRREIKKKNPDIANILFDSMWNALEYVYENRNKYYVDYSSQIDYFKKLYEQAGVPFPEDVTAIKSDNDYLIYSGRANKP
jgi:hypothetical protein